MERINSSSPFDTSENDSTKNLEKTTDRDLYRMKTVIKRK
jgi:hypothetical protein